MAIRYAILGLLSEQPMHGYRLKRVFDERVSPLWGLTTGQVYQSLDALERAALVESRGVRRRNRPARRVYSITVAGERDLAAWLAGPTTWVRPVREEIMIRFMMLEMHRADDLFGALERQTAEANELLASVTKARASRTPISHELDLPALFLASMTHHLEADLKNLRLFRDQVALLRNHVAAADETARVS